MFLVLLCAVLTHVTAAPPVSEAVRNYLRKYGHLTTDNGTDLHSALRSLQYMGQLTQTGVLDGPTRKLLEMSRCTTSDYVGFSMRARRRRRRRRRYAVEGTKWSKVDLTYGFKNFMTKLSEEVQRDIIRRSLEFWSSTSALTFRESSSPDIEVRFAVGEHGDSFPFDGPGGTLAHAFFPGSGGEAHFDADEPWTDGLPTGASLLQVATHELGHSLGLAHSGEPGSIMTPYYVSYSTDFRLGQDDIDGIQYIYGPPGFPKNPSIKSKGSLVPHQSKKHGNIILPTVTSSTGSLPSLLCSDSTIDAIVAIEQIIYVFKGDLYYKLNSDDGVIETPRLIRDTWPEVGGPIDTALYYDPILRIDELGMSIEVDAGHLFFFRGSGYWKYEHLTQLNKSAIYPRSVEIGFPGVPSDLTAAFTWSGNGRVYFIKGDHYYRYTKHVGVDEGYPRPLNVWDGLPSTGIRAAFQWTNKRTYFFGGSIYYRFNDITFTVDDGYPRDTAVWWFGCTYHSQHLPMSNIQSEYDEGRHQFKNIYQSNGRNEGQRTNIDALILLYIILWQFSLLISF